jgi:excisionase family DNA binding protein
MPHDYVIHTADMPTIDIATAAQSLGVSQRTVRRLVASRTISHRRLAGLSRFTQADIDRYVKSISVSAESAVH